MRRCYHCSKELNSYKKSAEIPNKEGWHYIVCSCGNVMKAKFQEKEIIDLAKTGQMPSMKMIYDEMQEAAELLKKANHNVSQFAISSVSSKQNVSDIQKLKEKELEEYQEQEPSKPEVQLESEIVPEESTDSEYVKTDAPAEVPDVEYHEEYEFTEEWHDPVFDDTRWYHKVLEWVKSLFAK